MAARAGLPRPQTQIYLNGFRVDFYWPDLGLVVETDGLRYHRTPQQQARDRLRDQAHAASGLTPLRFTHAQADTTPPASRRPSRSSPPASARSAPRDERRKHPGTLGDVSTPLAQLRAAVEDAAGAVASGAAPRTSPTLERPPRADFGDYSTNAA